MYNVGVQNTIIQVLEEQYFSSLNDKSINSVANDISINILTSKFYLLISLPIKVCFAYKCREFLDMITIGVAAMLRFLHFTASECTANKIDLCNITLRMQGPGN